MLPAKERIRRGGRLRDLQHRQDGYSPTARDGKSHEAGCRERLGHKKAGSHKSRLIIYFRSSIRLRSPGERPRDS